MDQKAVGSGGSSSTPRVYSRKTEKPVIVLGSNPEVSMMSKRKFADEPRITAAILPPPPAHSNTTRLRNSEDKKLANHFENTANPKLASDDSSIKSNETVVEEGRSRPNPTAKSSSIRPTASPKNTTASTNEADFGDAISSVWNKMKKLMGFSPNCHNGGHKNLRGNCECPKYFEGDLCEKIICINNGTKTTIKTMIPVQEVCKCPYPRFISGPHCEFIHCQNGGKDAGDGSCRCSDGWYSGQFCEFYASNWLATVGVPLICLIVIFMCCIVCRLDLCPRRSSSRRERRRNHYNNYQMPSRRTYANNPHRFHAHNNPQNITENARMMQENLLNDAACRRTRSRTNESSVNAPTVFRLEHNPIFNPEIMNSPEYKLDLPPPSYEQATRCTPVQSNYHPNTATAILPDYSPPRTNSQSHQTPRQNSQSNENG